MINYPFPIVLSSQMQCFAIVKTCILLPAGTGQQLTQHLPQYSTHVDIFKVSSTLALGDLLDFDNVKINQTEFMFSKGLQYGQKIL